MRMQAAVRSVASTNADRGSLSTAAETAPRCTEQPPYRPSPCRRGMLLSDNLSHPPVPRQRGRSQLEGVVRPGRRAALWIRRRGVPRPARHGPRDRFGLGRRRTARHCNGERLSEYLERSGIRVGGRFRGSAPGDRRPACQAVFAIQWLWSFSRLCVALTNRHSDCAAALPLRMNRSMCRLYLICP
jgi:hypothetical protein